MSLERIEKRLKGWRQLRDDGCTRTSILAAIRLADDVVKLARALRHTQEPLRLAIYGEATDEMLEVAWAEAERTLREVAGARIGSDTDGERQRKPAQAGDGISRERPKPDAEGPPSGDEASPRLKFETSEAMPGDQIALVPRRRTAERTENWLKRWKVLKEVKP